jgi:hypothetical protein
MLTYSCRCRRCAHPPDLGPHAGGRPSKKDIGCVRVRQSAGSALRAVAAGGGEGAVVGVVVVVPKCTPTFTVSLLYVRTVGRITP